MTRASLGRAREPTAEPEHASDSYGGGNGNDPLFWYVAIGFAVLLAGAGLLWLVIALHPAPAATVNGQMPVFSFNSTEGPFLAVSDDEGQSFHPGEPMTLFQPGQKIAFINDVTVRPGVSGCAILLLIRLNPETIIRSTRRCSISANEIRTGPRTVLYDLPIDTPDGNYELRRNVVYTLPSGLTAHGTFSPIHFSVHKNAAAAAAAAAAAVTASKSLR